MNELKDIGSITSSFNDFISRYNILPKQGTQEWKEWRNGSFGGSELASVIGCGSKTANKLLREKLGLDEGFSGNDYTLWGSFFETIHRHILEEYFDTSITELSAIPFDFNTNRALLDVDIKNKNQTMFKYSPDGLAIVSRSILVSTWPSLEDTLPKSQEFFIVLFEQKAPAARVSVADVIPKYYEPQIKSGLCVCDISHLGIYTESTFRRCSYEDLNNASSFSPSFFRENQKLTDVISYGIVLVYGTNKTSVKKLRSRYLTLDEEQTSEHLVDFGEKRHTTHFFNVIDGAKNPDVSFEYYYHNDLTCIQHDSMLIGFIPWKLYRLELVHVLPDKGYLKKYKPHLEACIDIIRNYSSESIDTKNAAIKKCVSSLKKLYKADK